MVRKRTERRLRERDARALVRDREKLFALSPGGSPARPLEVPSPAVIEGRVAAMPCPQCGDTYTIHDHQAEAGLRVVSVTCRLCHVPRRIWFRLGAPVSSS